MIDWQVDRASIYGACPLPRKSRLIGKGLGPHRCRGVTLIELMAVVAIVAFLATVGSGAYQGYMDRARVAKAIGDVGIISLEIAKFDARNLRLPNSLAELGMDPSMLIDPYGNPYQYLNLGTLNGVGGARKDHNNVQLNRDYDLYSFGKDGVTNQTFTSRLSQDDIVRAASGTYLGTARDYSKIPGQN